MNNCLHCNSNSWIPSHLPSTVFCQKEFSYLKCSNCGIIQISPIPNQEDLLNIYPTSYQAGFDPADGHDPNKKMLGLRIPYTKQWDLMGLHGKSEKQTWPSTYKPLTVVDFGCGNGHFIASTRQYTGQHIIGVEFNPQHVEVLKAEDPKGEYYTVEEIFTTQFLEKVDVIRMSNVWEHFTDPDKFMRSILATLKPNGTLVVEGPIETNPNIAYWFRKYAFLLKKRLNPNWKASHVPTHILFTNAKIQKAVFNKLNLKQEYWKVTEAEWPFPAQPKNLKQLPLWLVARFSMLKSKFIPSWGNTFVYVGRK